MRHLNLTESVIVLITGEMAGSNEKFKLQICGELAKCLLEIKNRFLHYLTELAETNDNILENIVDELCDGEIAYIYKLEITVEATGETQVYIEQNEPTLEIVFV